MLGASSDELEEELFADSSDIQESLDHTISSHTVVTVECKQKQVTNVHLLCLFLVKMTQMLLSEFCNADLPGLPDLQLEGETRKDNSVILSCSLNDPGHPRASHFVWER